MKYLIFIICSTTLIACNSSNENSEIILHNEILNGSINKIYEAKYVSIPSADTTNNSNTTYNQVIDSSLRIINENGFLESHSFFAFQNGQSFPIRESKVFYKDDIIASGQDFYYGDNTSLNSVVVEHNTQNLPTLIQAIINNNVVGYSKLQYNDKGLSIESTALAADKATTKWTTITTYNDKNHVNKTINTNLETGAISTTTFEYLTYDEKGNWTSRKEYNDASDRPNLVYRTYEYYK